MKAWYEQERFRWETAALRQWAGWPAVAVHHAAADLMVAAIDLVGGVPGGQPRPSSDVQMVGSALVELHARTRGIDQGSYPQLEDHMRNEVFPRIRRRLGRLDGGVEERCADWGMDALQRLDVHHQPPVLLHTDLYQENVPFDADGIPTFIDPLPMIGNPAFDWAFWVVYYDLSRDPRRRFRLACRMGKLLPDVLRAWCLSLCLDGLLYYTEIDDPRTARMAWVMTLLASTD